MAVNQTITESPAIVNLSIFPGDTLFETINLTDALGDPIDLTSYTISAEITDVDGVTTYPFTIAYPSRSQGQTTIELDFQTTAKIIDGSTWAYRWVDPSLRVKTILYGKVIHTQV